jgi:hypothetical protein
VLHLKRFSQARGRTKLSTHVDFPINNLKLDDLTDVMSESYEGKIFDKKSEFYSKKTFV